MYYRNRMYETGLGRFVGRDPIGYGGSKWNLYQYVSSQPNLWTDALGWTETIFKKAFTFSNRAFRGAEKISEFSFQHHFDSCQQRKRLWPGETWATDFKTTIDPDEMRIDPTDIIDNIIFPAVPVLHPVPDNRDDYALGIVWANVKYSLRVEELSDEWVICTPGDQGDAPYDSLFKGEGLRNIKQYKVDIIVEAKYFGWKGHAALREKGIMGSATVRIHGLCCCLKRKPTMDTLGTGGLLSR